MVNEDDVTPESVKPEDLGQLGQGERQNSGGGWRALLVPAVISVIVTFVALQFFIFPIIPKDGVSKADFDASIQNLSNDINGLRTSVNSLSGLGGQISQTNTLVNAINQEIATMKGTMATYATPAQLTALQNSITTLQNDLNSIKSSIPDKTVVANLQSSVTALQTQVTALQAKVGGTTPSSSGVSSTPIYIKFAVLDEGTFNSADNSSIASIKLSISNNSTASIEDPIIGIVLYIDSRTAPIDYVLSGDTDWYIKSSTYRTVEIRNKRGYILRTDRVWKIYLDLKSFYSISTSAEGARLEDYDIQVISWD